MERKKKWKTLIGYIIVRHDNKLIEKKTFIKFNQVSFLKHHTYHSWNGFLFQFILHFHIRLKNSQCCPQIYVRLSC